MIRRSKLAGSGLLALGCIAVVAAAATAPGSGEPATPTDAILAIGAPPTRATAPAPVPVRVRGLVCANVSSVLASQLNVDPAGALVVQHVEPGSAADAAGLEEYDVVLLISGRPADAATLEAVVGEGGRVELDILRAGEPQVAVLPDTAPAASQFVAADALGPNHPIVRLRELNRLQDSLERESSGVSVRRREVAQAQREARGEARAAAEELHAQCVEEAQTFFDARREALYAAVDEAFARERIDPLAALRLDLETVLPAASVAALDHALHDLAHDMEDNLAARVSRSGVPSEGSLRHVAGVLSSRLHERVQQPWADVAARHERHAQDLGAHHDERMRWAGERLAQTRAELHERIDCAVERSVERFSKRLAGRLSSMDVPRSTEIEASLKDVAGQLDAWTNGFVRELVHGLAAYQDQVEPARAELAAMLPAHFAAAENGRLALVQRFDVLLGEPFAPTAVDELSTSDWRRDDAARAFLSSLRASLEDAVNGGRDVLRPRANEIRDLLHDEEERSDEAWSDLRDMLKRLESRAGDDCWKLHGPHLDGRFESRGRGEVAAAD